MGRITQSIPQRIELFVKDMPVIPNIEKWKRAYSFLSAYNKTVQGYMSGSASAEKMHDEKCLLMDMGLDVDSLKPLQQHCSSEVVALKRQYKLRSISSHLTKYRKAIKDVYGNHPALVFLSLSKSDYEAIDKLDLNSRKESSAKRAVITQDDIENITKQASRMCLSHNFYIAALGVMALTGRRAIEVVKTGWFELSDNTLDFTSKDSDNPNELEISNVQVLFPVLSFSGQAKKKGLNNDAYNIPVMGDPQLIVDTVKRLRTLQGFVVGADKGKGIPLILECDDLEKINAIINKPMSRQFAKMFQGRDYCIKPHVLRHIYANYFYDEISKELSKVYAFINPSSTKHKLIIMGAFLGHSEKAKGAKATQAYETLVQYVDATHALEQ